jgi:hypothetical protein
MRLRNPSNHEDMKRTLSAIALLLVACQSFAAEARPLKLGESKTYTWAEILMEENQGANDRKGAANSATPVTPLSISPPGICSSNGPRTNSPLPPNTTLLSALPMATESLGLYLETEARKGRMGAPYTVLCNVSLSQLNNTSIPIWTFPRITFYAQQGGEFYPLRVLEEHSGGISAPHSKSGHSVTLPRPPRSGKWNIFAVQEHSELVYRNHLKDHTEKAPLVHVEDQDESYNGMWTKPLVSNAIALEFTELGPADMKLAEGVIQGLIEAGQFKTGFRQSHEDPTRQMRQIEQ